MKIFLFGYFNNPPSMAPAKRTICLAKGLQAAGAMIEIDIVHWYFDGGQIKEVKPVGEYEGIKYNFVNGDKKYKNDLELRWDLKVSDKKGAAKYILTNANGGDIVYIYSGNNNDILAILKAAKKRRCKTVLELVEIPYYTDKIIAKYHRWIHEHLIMPKFDGFSCISSELMKYAQEYASPSAKIINIPILVENVEQKLGEPIFDFPYIIHTGTMQEQKDGISIILMAFAEFKKGDKTGCKLVFAGPHSNERCSYIPMMKELGVYDDVMLLGMIKDLEKLSTLQRNASLSIVYRYDNIQTRNGFSTKMGEVLMAGAPLITTPIGGHAKYLQNGKNAFIVEPGNVKALTDAICYILTNPEKAKEVAKEGKNLATNVFNPIYQGKKLYEFFQNL